jgi:tRNA(Ile)-lysidine synthase
MRGARPGSALEQHVERAEIIRKGDRVLVACSGGADSVALAAVLRAVRKPLRLGLTLAYVNHRTRESAWQDECVVLRVASALGLPVRICDLAGGVSDEASLRDARYAALARTALECAANVVATAHHREDQSETVLLALLRGAGASGLRGMRPRRALGESLELARPLLGVAADDLRYYCQVQALPYAVDPTNANPALRRNAVRQALSALRPVFPGLDAAIARAALVLREEAEQSPRADLRAGVRRLLDEQGELFDVDFAHVEAAVRAIERGRSGRFHMKAGIELRVERGAIAAIRRTR